MSRVCKQCGAKIPKFSESETNYHKKKFCSYDCMGKWGLQELRRKQMIAEEKDRAYRDDFQRRLANGEFEQEKVADWLKKCEKVVNKYVRIRDRGRPCICCDWPDDGSNARHASHFRSVGACSSLRFNLWNIHAGCAQCNVMKSGNISEYRLRLIEKIGIERVEWIESQPKQKRFDLHYLKKLYATFLKLNKRLEKRNERTD